MSLAIAAIGGRLLVKKYKDTRVQKAHLSVRTLASPPVVGEV